MPDIRDRIEQRRVEQRRIARKVAREAYLDAGGDAEAAKASLRGRFREVGISPAMILLFIKLAIMFIDWWFSKGVSDPPAAEPVGGELIDLPEDDQPLWGTPKRRRVRGSYEAADYAPRGKFGPREAGSVFENTVIVSGVSAVAMAVDQLATSYTPGLPSGMAGVSTWLLQVVIWVACKAWASTFRSYGASLLRDLGAWIWDQLLSGFWSGLKDSLRSLWPFGRRRRRIRPDLEQKRERRRPIIDRLFPRRRRER